MDILNRLSALEKQASDFGFKWENAEQIIDQVRSEITEIEAHLKDQDHNKLQDEIGDLLHAAFSLCVFCQLDPEATLTKSVDKFDRRFATVKQLAHSQGITNLNGKSFTELMDLWDKAKQIVG